MLANTSPIIVDPHNVIQIRANGVKPCGAIPDSSTPSEWLHYADSSLYAHSRNETGCYQSDSSKVSPWIYLTLF